MTRIDEDERSTFFLTSAAAAVVIPLAAAFGWLGLVALDAVVRLVAFREQPSQGVVSLLWGAGFALLLWAGGSALGLGETRAIAFALVAGGAIALFIYLRGAALENPPAGRPGVSCRRLVTRLRAGRV